MANGIPAFYYDLVSPYSCLAAFRVEGILPAPPVWQPVWAAPLIVASGRDWRPSFEEGRERRADIVRRAARNGMFEWHWPPAYLPADQEAHSRWQAPNTLAVMRLATFAHQSGVGEQFARGVFKLAFGEGHDISQIDDAVTEVAEALRSATNSAVARGVIGVLTVTVGGLLFWGDDRPDEAAAAMV